MTQNNEEDAELEQQRLRQTLNDGDNRIRQQLAKQGVSPKDITIGMRLFYAINRIDGVIFPEKHLAVHIEPGEARGVARYTRVHNGVESFYSVFFKGIANKTSNVPGNQPFLDDQGRKLQQLPPPSVGRKLSSIAVHEVRHRMQSDIPNLKKFQPSDGQTEKDPLVGTIIRVAESMFGELKKDMLEAKAPKALIDKICHPFEFDAFVIENLMVHRFTENMTLDEVASVLRTEPAR
jgi:hypothetical protein